MYNSLLNIFLLIAAFSAVAFLPIWLLAKVARAQRSTWLAALLAALQMGVIFTVSQSTYLNSYVTTALQLLGSAAVFTYTLRTSFFRGLSISILVIAIILGCLYFLSGPNVSIHAA